MTRAPAILLLCMAATQGVAGADERTKLEAARKCFEARCSVCHTPDRPLKKRKDRAGWEKTIARMSGYAGTSPSDPETRAIVEYLSHACGPTP